MIEKYGKEMPHASFSKWTSSRFLSNLRTNHPNVLPFSQEETVERNHRFWQRDPMAILMDSRLKVEQKIDYIHTNPLQPKWNLAISQEEYYWLIARFYETGEDTFGFLSHYRDRF